MAIYALRVPNKTGGGAFVPVWQNLSSPMRCGPGSILSCRAGAPGPRAVAHRWTIARSKERDSTTSGTLYDFLEEILLRKHAPETTEHQREVMLRFAMKLQQLTGPVMAKGLEDTAFYVYNRLVALNEVGGEPQHFGISVDYFHLRNQERAMKWPAALLASSTHDTKRSEDVRARLAVLSEVPEEWKEHLRRWTRLNRRFKSRVRSGLAPDNNDEYLFYQR